MGRIVNNDRQMPIGLIDDNLLRDICLGQYVLVLGDDVILKQEYGAGNSTDYILKECKEGLKQEDVSDFEKGAVNMKTLIRKMLCNKDEWAYSLDEISESLVKLIKTRCFPLVLTTTFDGYVESLMREVYGESLNVVNFSENKAAIQYKEEYNVLVPTLFYVFGKAEKNLEFAFTEDDYMKILCKWMDAGSRPDKLIEYLRTKKILAIGGKYENWYFRFFWYSLRQSLTEGQREGDVAISLENDNAGRLQKFMDRNGIKNHTNSRDFLDKLSHDLCEPDKILSSIHAAHLRNLGGVFISYAHEDYPIVCQIYGTLLSWGIPVWFDNEKLKDYSKDNKENDYDKRIEIAISQCKVFLPILSRQVKMDLENKESRYYMNKEWNIALNNKSSVVLPIALYGFEKRKDAALLSHALFVGKDIIDWAIDGENGLYNALLSIFKS